MKRHIQFILALALLAGTARAQNQTNRPDDGLSKVFSSDKEKFSYFIGKASGSGIKNLIKRSGFDLDLELAAKTFREEAAGGASLIPDAQMQQIGQELMQAIQAATEAKGRQQAKDFAETNNPGVVILTNGLEYKIMTDSSGTNPAPTDEVTVNYVGMLPDGTEFDSSKKRNTPFTTPIQGRVIEGWKQVLQLMKVGSKWRVFVPAAMAYDKSPPRGSIIPPGSPLVFEIELLSAKPMSAPVAKPTAMMATPGIPPNTTGAPLTSDIIKVPSKEEMDKGAKIETIKAEDLEKAKLTNNPAKIP